ncbi:hypothetical protein Tco_0543529 [Tanacetum coccineum]
MVAYLQKSEGSEGFHQIIDFLTTSHINTLENRDMEITATIDGKVKVVSEASIRRHLKLEDSDGISTLPTSKNFKQLALMGAPSTSQLPTSPPFMQITHVAKEAAAMPHDSPLLGGHTLGSNEGSMTLNELTVLCTQLSTKVVSLEADLKQTKKVYGNAYTKLIMKVKKLEHKGRKIALIDEDKGITLVPNFKFTAPKEDYTTEPYISTANVPVSTAGAEVSTASPEVRTVAESLVYIRRSATKRKDKGKAIMKEAEPIWKKTNLQLEVQEEASTFNTEEWDNIQAQMEADEELPHRLQAQERERYSEADKARLLHIGSHTLQELKKLSFDEIKELFEITMKKVNTFTLMESDDTVPKVIPGSSKRDADQELNQESSKRQKIGEGSEPAEESKDELSQE